jgi:hypothetical protein
LNAIRHGFLARQLRADEAADLQEAAAKTLSGEIALTRVAARRMLARLEAERTVGARSR